MSTNALTDVPLFTLVRKRKVDKSDKITNKIFKTETVDQIELRNSMTLPSHHGTHSPILNHQLPLSPVSLASPPSTPDPTEADTVNSPTELQNLSKRTSQDLDMFSRQVLSQVDAKSTLGKCDLNKL